MAEFVRCLFLESIDKELNLVQLNEGDVNCVVWDAAIALAKFLDHSKQSTSDVGVSVTEKRIVELGAGTGCVGLTSALLGASSVILTDLPEGLELLQKNIELNSENIPSVVRAQELTWGNMDHAKCIESPDIILVADCIYYRKSLTDLVVTLEELAKEGAMILLSYEERSFTENPSLQQDFFAEMERHFSKEEIPLDHHHPVFQSPDIHLFKFLRKGSQTDGANVAEGS